MHRHVVLIVEDHPDTCGAITALLEGEGYRVACAVDGEDALAALQRGLRPCLILLDMMMPRMSGEEFRDIQRGSPEWHDIPVALYTGDGQAKEKARRLGLQHWFTKPLDVEQLLSVVSDYCQRGTSASPAAS